MSVRAGSANFIECKRRWSKVQYLPLQHVTRIEQPASHKKLSLPLCCKLHASFAIVPKVLIRTYITWSRKNHFRASNESCAFEAVVYKGCCYRARRRRTQQMVPTSAGGGAAGGLYFAIRLGRILRRSTWSHIATRTFQPQTTTAQ